MAPVEIRSLSKDYGPRRAVDDLSFQVEPGRVTGFLGPNGAGKSTTLRILLGLAVASGGDATFGGRAYRALTDPARSVGAVLETTRFHPGRTGRNHLRTLAVAAGVHGSRPGELLELVGLSDAADQRVKGYSLGMRQRLALAAALLGDPEVLVLDEPANGLDPGGVRWLRSLMRARADAGHAVLVSSHGLAEVAQTVDDVVVIADGRMRASGTVAEVVGTGGESTVRVRTAEPDRLAEMLRGQGATVVPSDDGALLVRGASLEAVGTTAAGAGLPVFELSESRRSLEEAFFELTGQPPRPGPAV